MLSKNIARLRRLRGETQESLAERLGCTAQAVSRWETGATTPDVQTLARLSQILGTSMDELTGFSYIPKTSSPYAQWYESPEYYWGVQPSELCLRIIRLKPPVRPWRVLDIGCGEGKDAVFLARCGYDVTAFDVAAAGIEKTKMLAQKAGVFVRAFQADLCTYRPEETFDIVYSSGVLHYMPTEIRAEFFAYYRKHTSPDGLHAMNVFVQKPFIAPPPEKETSYVWKSGELMTLYHDWRLEHCTEEIFDCCSSGVPHQHAMDVVIARNMDGNKTE